MTLKRRQFTKEFKLQVIREVEAGKTVPKLSASTNYIPTRSSSGASSRSSTPSAPSPATARLIKMRRASRNSNGWSVS